MLFSDRLEVWNPGQLPPNLTLSKLRTVHGSFPANPLLAEPMYLAGYIERIGTGTGDMIRLCREAGLKEPDFRQDDVFKIIIWRKDEYTGQLTGQVTGQPTGQVNEVIRRVILVIEGEVKRSEIQDSLELKHRETFVDNYLNPALTENLVEMTIPEKPNSPNQKYRLTPKGLSLKKELLKKPKNKK